MKNAWPELSKTQASNLNNPLKKGWNAMKNPYRRYKVGEVIQVSERDYMGGNTPNNKAKRIVNTYKVVQDYPLFVVCERKARYGSAKIKITIPKWNIEHSSREGVVIL